MPECSTFLDSLADYAYILALFLGLACFLYFFMCFQLCNIVEGREWESLQMDPVVCRVHWCIM